MSSIFGQKCQKYTFPFFLLSCVCKLNISVFQPVGHKKNYLKISACALCWYVWKNIDRNLHSFTDRCVWNRLLQRGCLPGLLHFQISLFVCSLCHVYVISILVTLHELAIQTFSLNLSKFGFVWWSVHLLDFAFTHSLLKWLRIICNTICSFHSNSA